MRRTHREGSLTFGEDEMSSIRPIATLRPFRKAPAWTLALALTVTGPAPAQVLIDDFETGSFTLGPDDNDGQAVGPGHALSPTRAVYTHGDSYASLGSTIGNDGVVMNGPPGWQVQMWWDSTAPIDITHGGIYDRFVFQMDSVDSVIVQVCVSEGPAMYWGGTKTLGNPDPEILLSDLTNSGLTDFHQVTDVEVWFTDNGGFFGNYATVWNIRVGRSSLGFASVDVINQQFCWCAGCPPELSVIDVSIGSARGDYQKYARVGDIFPANPAFKVMVDMFDDGGAVGSWGEALGSAVYWDSTAYSTSTFDFVTEFVQTGTKTPTIASSPVLTVVDPATIALQYVVRVDDANTGALLGNSVETVMWDVFPGQGLEFKAASATPIEPALAGSGVTGGVQLSFTLEATGAVDIALPLVTSQTVADWAAGTTPTAVTPIPERVGGAGLSAAPSITRSGTHLTFASPRPSAGTLHVFDVAGRIARRLDFATGATTVDWDGRGSSGSLLPPGVYFVSLPDAGNQFTARVVLVR
jgi:hypothetical protein